MCGLFGYIGEGDATGIAVTGIKRLEYRGYDSAGLAAIIDGKIVCEKSVGPVSLLESAVLEKNWKARVAISHTRWATHGRPTLLNAHPHIGGDQVAVVHNGIVENDKAIRNRLKEQGITFRTETDSEVIAELIAYFYKGNFLKAFQEAVSNLQGSYALAAIHKNHPDLILAAASGAPLCIGLGEKEMFIASDPHAFLPKTRRVVTLSSSEVALLTADSLTVFDSRASQIEKKWIDLAPSALAESREGFAHYTLKEIHEQTKTVEAALSGRLLPDSSFLDEVNISDERLKEVERIVITACGTSYHAGLIAGLLLEEMARIPVQVEIASELRFRNPIIPKKTLVIAISQSGETADLLAALQELKAKGAYTLGICNVPSSTLTREVDATLFLRAGAEIGVASTKAFTSQLVTLTLFALKMARMRNLSKERGALLVEGLLRLPSQIGEVLDQADAVAGLARRYAGFTNFFYLGRRYMYPAALEGSLKIKEIAYIPSQAYPAGELKHGPIALIDEECLTVAFTADSVTYSKMTSSLHEVKARSGKIFAIASNPEILEIADDAIFIPETCDELAPILSTIVSQLFAYYVALERGCEIDKPRNLAKSVTVE